MVNQKVLFVDDEEGVRVSWSRYLTSDGFDVSTAENVEQGIAQIENDDISVIVSDLKMPGQNGLQFLEWVKTTHPEIQFILLTGYGDEDTELQANEGGAFKYLTKPIGPDQMEEVIRAAFQQSEEDLALQAISLEDLNEVVEDLKQKSSLRKSTEIVSGLVLAPVLGLAFVIFLPVVGFIAVIYSVGEKVYTKFFKVDSE